MSAVRARPVGRPTADSGADSGPGGGAPTGDGAAGPAVLLAEDDAELRALLELSLRREGLEVVAVASGTALRAALAERDYALVVTDVSMPGASGLEVLAEAAEAGRAPTAIVITAFGDADVHAAAAALGVRAVLDKPFALGVLVREVRALLPTPIAAVG